MPRKIEISHRTIIFTVLFLGSIWFLYYIRDIILLLFVSLLLMAIINPLVKFLTRYKIPQALSIVAVYVVFLSLLSISIGSIIPPLVEQTTVFATNLPQYFENVGISRVLSEQLVSQVVSQIGMIPSQLLKVSVWLFSNFLNVIFVLILSFYLLLSRDIFPKKLGIFFNKDKVDFISKFLDELEIKLGGWARGELILMVLVGSLNFIGLTLLGIPFALPLAIIAGVLELIPNIGPTIAAIPAILIGFGVSPFSGFACLALAFLVQQLENYIFVPKIMQKSVGVNPVATLIALSIGFKLAGFLGALISVPVFLTAQILFVNYFKEG